MAKISFGVGGMPVRFDVERLMKEIDARPGSRVAYEDVEKIVGADAKANRFSTVTSSWRNKLFREKLVQTKREGGYFHFLTADESHDDARRKFVHVGRAARKLALRVESIDVAELTGPRADVHGRLRREALALREAAAAGVKAIAAPRPVEASPRLGMK